MKPIDHAHHRLGAGLAALVLAVLSPAPPAAAQASSPADSARVLVLPDVQIQDRIAQLTVASGTEDRRTWHVWSPGVGCAVRFRAPRAGYHELRQLRVHLDSPGAIREGALRVRVASVSGAQQPAANDLLPQPVVLDTRTLRRSRRSLTLQWPNYHLVVPPEGFFLVVEGLGKQPDEVISSLLPPTRQCKLGRYEITRRGQPQPVLRVVDVDAFPKLRGARYTGEAAEVWRRIPRSGEWQAEATGSSIPMLEVVFE